MKRFTKQREALQTEVSVLQFPTGPSYEHGGEADIVVIFSAR